MEELLDSEIEKYDNETEWDYLFWEVSSSIQEEIQEGLTPHGLFSK